MSHFQIAFLASFLVRFCRIIARWKGLELKFSDLLPHITICKVLLKVMIRNVRNTLLKIIQNFFSRV
jgi:hypothetical protein